MIKVTLNEHLEKIGYSSSLRELADSIGYNREKLRRFAANEMKMYPSDLLNDLCEYLDCGLTDLIIYHDDKTK